MTGTMPLKLEMPPLSRKTVLAFFYYDQMITFIIKY